MTAHGTEPTFVALYKSVGFRGQSRRSCRGSTEASVDHSAPEDWASVAAQQVRRLLQGREIRDTFEAATRSLDDFAQHSRRCCVYKPMVRQGSWSEPARLTEMNARRSP